VTDHSAGGVAFILGDFDEIVVGVTKIDCYDWSGCSCPTYGAFLDDHGEGLECACRLDIADSENEVIKAVDLHLPSRR